MGSGAIRRRPPLGMEGSMLQAVSNAFKLPDLRRKIVFTLAILVVYRLAAHIRCRGECRGTASGVPAEPVAGAL